ncbi:hypothetical protein EJ110_NYTH21907 [Nymphaea thermarum]|nr:hypothetical protein EJ110_NYTH21907 [Nymphaea thermarum]
MKIDIEVRGSITEMKPPEAIHPADSGFLVNIGLLLNDKLKVIVKNGKMTKSQYCYEQKIITRYSTQIRDASYGEQLAYSTLHDDMDMDQKVTEKVKAEVHRTIMNKLEVARNDSPSISTIFMVICVDCTIEISDQKGGESTNMAARHGYDWLLERLGNDDCSICYEDFESTDHILLTTCKHPFHYSYYPNADNYSPAYALLSVRELLKEAPATKYR